MEVTVFTNKEINLKFVDFRSMENLFLALMLYDDIFPFVLYMLLAQAILYSLTYIKSCPSRTKPLLNRPSDKTKSYICISNTCL